MSTTREPGAEVAVSAARTSSRTASEDEADSPSQVSADAADSPSQASGPPWWRRLPRARSYGWRPTAAVAVIAALLLTGGGLLYAGQRLTDPAATGNHALTDTEATNRVTGDVSNALGKIFAYTPDDTASTARAADDLLDGAAAGQYRALFAQIQQRVADQQLTLTTRVVRAGVVSLTADRARLLVFLDQTAQRKGATATSAAAQLSVSARLEGDRWRITDLKAR